MGQPHTRGRCFGPQAQQLGLGAGGSPQIIPPGAGGCSPSGGKGAARSPRGLLAPAASRSRQGQAATLLPGGPSQHQAHYYYYLFVCF